MNVFEVIMPKMGESIEEATITKWFIKIGDQVKEDDLLLEIATDKVDSEIPSPVAGIVSKILFKQDDIVPVGSVIAIINLDNGDESGKNQNSNDKPTDEVQKTDSEQTNTPIVESDKKSTKDSGQTSQELVTDTQSESDKSAQDSSDQSTAESKNQPISPNSKSDRFYSPLVRKIADEESISQNELDSIKGTGKDGRVQKNDILEFIKNKKPGKEESMSDENLSDTSQTQTPKVHNEPESLNKSEEIVPMDRIRKIIAGHMIKSIQVSAHVTNIIEVDVTDIVNWRNRIKENFEKKEGTKITYLPIFLESVIKALKDFPMINSSVEGENIIIKRRINLGIAVSLANYNLIVPVIKNADNLNITGLTKELNRLADAARNNRLKPDETQDGTFTITNFGSFKNSIGTPIINQPQVAILAVGAIEKKPAVLETEKGDVIAIRQKMFLSLTYDHRIIDGSLGGAFLRKIGDYIESFDSSRTL